MKLGLIVIPKTEQLDKLEIEQVLRLLTIANSGASNRQARFAPGFKRTMASILQGRVNAAPAITAR